MASLSIVELFFFDGFEVIIYITKMKIEVQIKDNKIFAPLQTKWLVLKPDEI